MRYRDTKTGKFVSAATWRRSRAHGGKRYRRVTTRKTKPHRIVRPAAPPGFAREFVRTGAIPIEFMEAADEFFESGYESDEEDEYP